MEKDKMIKLLAIYTGLLTLAALVAFAVVLVQLDNQITATSRALDPLLGK